MPALRNSTTSAAAASTAASAGTRSYIALASAKTLAQRSWRTAAAPDDGSLPAKMPKAAGGGRAGKPPPFSDDQRAWILHRASRWQEVAPTKVLAQWCEDGVAACVLPTNAGKEQLKERLRQVFRTYFKRPEQ